MDSSDRYVPMFGDPVTGWTGWFAWRPVETWDGRWRWLWWVQRQRIAKHSYLDGGADFWWRYRLSHDAIAAMEVG